MLKKLALVLLLLAPMSAQAGVTRKAAKGVAKASKAVWHFVF